MAYFNSIPPHNSAHVRPGGTGPVGPAMAGPTFELGRFLLKIKKECKSKVYTLIRRHLLTGK